MFGIVDSVRSGVVRTRMNRRLDRFSDVDPLARTRAVELAQFANDHDYRILYDTVVSGEQGVSFEIKLRAGRFHVKINVQLNGRFTFTATETNVRGEVRDRQVFENLSMEKATHLLRNPVKMTH